jgi:hypothetical protein
MRSLKFGPLQAAVAFTLGVVVGSGMLGGFTKAPHVVPEPMTTSGIMPTCTSGDEVADFVCRNTWLANRRHSFR